MGLNLRAASGNFIPTIAYNDLVTGIVCINDNNPFSEGSDAARLWFENEVKLKLGLIADIWPLEIRGDLVIDALEHTERQQNVADCAGFATPAR